MPDPTPQTAGPVPVVSAAVEPTPPPVQPVVVTVASTRTSAMTAMTGVGHPDFIVKGVQPLLIIAVRASRLFLQVWMGLVTAGLAAPKALPASDFLHLCYLCASLTVAPTVLCIGQNALELLGKIDQKFPVLSG